MPEPRNPATTPSPMTKAECVAKYGADAPTPP